MNIAFTVPADVIITVASSKSVRTAAQPPCAAISRAAALRSRPPRWTAQPFLCPSWGETNTHSARWRPSITQVTKPGARGAMTVAAHVEAEHHRRARPASRKLSPDSTPAQAKRALPRRCPCPCRPWRGTCEEEEEEEAAATSRRCTWRPKRSTRHLRCVWAAESRLRPAETPHAEEGEGIRLRSSWLTPPPPRCCCVSARSCLIVMLMSSVGRVYWFRYGNLTIIHYLKNKLILIFYHDMCPPPPSDSASTDRFFTTSGDGKTYLKIAPGECITRSVIVISHAHAHTHTHTRRRSVSHRTGVVLTHLSVHLPWPYILWNVSVGLCMTNTDKRFETDVTWHRRQHNDQVYVTTRLHVV